jgi:nucleoside transporter
MKDPEKDFSGIRVFGTIGWIVAGVLISNLFLWDSEANRTQGLLKNTFLLSGAASLLLGLFSFTLPRTPPKKTSGGKVSLREILGLDALRLFKDSNYLLFFIASILICIPLAFYYQITHEFLSNLKVSSVTSKMAIGQASEAIFLLLLPLFFKRFGFKKTILVGMLAWAVRYTLFAFGDAGDLVFMLLLGIALHGVCYDFFFVSGYIYTNSKAGEQYKSAAQGLITLATYGVGMLIGFEVAGFVKDHYQLGEGVFDYKAIWLIPAGIAAVIFVLFALLFKEEKKQI